MKKIVFLILVSFLFGGCDLNFLSNKVNNNSITYITPTPTDEVRGVTYQDFNQTDYEKALAEGKIIFLNFYANWCPICRAEDPEVLEGLKSIENDQIVAFRVNYKDDQTDEDEKKLASEFKVPYQHTKVIIKNGVQVFNQTVAWKKEDLIRVLGGIEN